jgi:hypothetical protein
MTSPNPEPARVWTVTGYERTTVMMRVEAETEVEAIEKAQRGEYNDVDSEPGPRLLRPAWDAVPGWRHSKGLRP